MKKSLLYNFSQRPIVCDKNNILPKGFLLTAIGNGHGFISSPKVSDGLMEHLFKQVDCSSQDITTKKLSEKEITEMSISLQQWRKFPFFNYSTEIATKTIMRLQTRVLIINVFTDVKIIVSYLLSTKAEYSTPNSTLTCIALHDDKIFDYQKLDNYAYNV